MSLLGFGPIADAPLCDETATASTTPKAVSATLTTTTSLGSKTVGKLVKPVVTTTVAFARAIAHKTAITLTTTASVIKAITHATISVGVHLSALVAAIGPTLTQSVAPLGLTQSPGSGISGGTFTRGKWRRIKKQLDDEDDEDDVEALLTAWMS